MTTDDDNGGSLPNLDKVDKETRKIIERLIAQRQPFMVNKKPNQEKDSPKNQD